jgi:prepilin peptidase CpaA
MLVALSLDRFALLLFLGLIAWAAYSDGTSLRIPNAISVGLAALYPVHVIACPVAVDWLGALLVAGLLFVAGLALFARGLLGGGDVKLLSAASLWAGPSLSPAFLTVMGLVGGLIASLIWLLSQMRRRRAAASSGSANFGVVAAPVEAVPYGIAIAAGAAYVGLCLFANGA